MSGKGDSTVVLLDLNYLSLAQNSYSSTVMNKKPGTFFNNEKACASFHTHSMNTCIGMLCWRVYPSAYWLVIVFNKKVMQAYQKQ